MEKEIYSNNSVFELTLNLKFNTYALRVKSTGTIIIALLLFILKMIPVLLKLIDSS